ncbi:alpha/beta hydrolase [Stenotrophomonas sp. 364]|uniref:alpha/beta fold hydrolase n=1 Tax=Stenotrophomonas sp. 364 TaxID=2691571 RepID=UPI00131876C1|nr:alpha/beta hydrolase [Stenotrophomonas sp. 364]QHB73665.1 alpha/beta fold hydrolase [Stenotrophomonas sp. 364]
MTAALESITHRHVRIDGRSVHCAILGEGRPVLLIPGWPQTWYAWRHILQALAAQGFQAIAVDPPGTGDSDTPAHGYDTGAIAATLHAVMQQLGHARYQVVGHDVGMWVAYALASDQPEAVQRLAITEAVIPGLAEAPPLFVAPEDNIFLWHFMFNQVRDLPEALIAGRERAYLTFMFDRWAHRREAVACEVYIRAYAAPGGLSGGFGYYRAIPETIRQNQQRARTPLAMPVLAIGAEHATANMPMDTMRAHAADLRGTMIADCGHFVMEEAPQAFLDQLLPFLLPDAAA